MPQLKPGDKAPSDFALTASDMSTVSGADLAGKARIVCSVPSVDTPVCDLEMKRFDAEVKKLDGVSLVSVSMDLPFALKRWCVATSSDKVLGLSDYKNRSFGTAYGVFAPAKGLLVRADKEVVEAQLRVARRRDEQECQRHQRGDGTGLGRCGRRLHQFTTPWA